MASSRSPRRPVQVLIPGFVGLLPLVHSMFLYRFFMVPQQALLLVALGALLAAASAGSLKWIRHETPAVKLALGSFGVVVAWIGMASALGTDPIRSLITDDFQGTSWVFWLTCLALFVAAVRFRDELTDGVSKAVTVAAGVLIGLTLLWLIGGDLVEEFLVPRSPAGVPLPGIGNSAFLGAFFGAAALISAGRWVGTSSGSHGLLAVAVVSAGLMVLTQSRVSMIATSILLVVGIWLSRNSRVLRLTTVGIAFLVAGSIVQLVVVPKLNPPGSKVPEAPSAGQDVAATKFDPEVIEGGLNVRRGIWGAAVNTIRNEPWLGVGANNFSFAYRRYASESHIRFAAQEALDEVNDAHNLMLEVAATGGLPAVMGLLLVLGSVGWVSRTSMPAGYGKTWAGLAALVLLAESMFQPLNLVSLPVMLILAGVAIPDRREADEPRLVRRSALVVAAVPVLASLIAAGMLLYSDQKLRRGALEWDADVAASASEANPYCTVCLFELGKIRRWDYIKEGKGSAEWALEPNLRAIDRHPLDSDAYLQLGGGLLFMQQPAKALFQFEKTLALDPHSWLAGQGTAVALLRLERFSEAVPYLQESARRRPSTQAYQVLAYAADKAGLSEVSAEAAQKAKELTNAESQS